MAFPKGFLTALLVSTPLALGGGALAAGYQVIAVRRGGVGLALAADGHGNLYGVDSMTGTDPYGELFELSPPAVSGGTWGATTLVSYANLFPEVNQPNAPTLLNGAILQTSVYGSHGAHQYSLGTVFLLSPTGAANLHAFTGTQTSTVDGANPTAAVTKGPYGLYYGTTPYTGLPGEETAYQISSSPTASNYAILHTFGGPGDGHEPNAQPLVTGTSGLLFGQTIVGGSHKEGTAYELGKQSGVWTERVIHNFGGAVDIQQPYGNLVMDSTGALYGCGGYLKGVTGALGALYRLDPPAQVSGAWTEELLYTFPGTTGAPNPSSGGPCGIARDAASGRIVGVTAQGGAFGYGAIFEIDPPAVAGGAWTETTLHSFDGTTGDGKYPSSAPVEVSGTYYGGSVTGAVYAETP